MHFCARLIIYGDQVTPAREGRLEGQGQPDCCDRRVQPQQSERAGYLDIEMALRTQEAAEFGQWGWWP
jgi:hypothetical protein